MESLLELFKDHVYQHYSHYHLHDLPFSNAPQRSSIPTYHSSTKFNFTKDGALAAIDRRAKPLHSPIIDYNVFFILDTSNKNTPYNSYVFYIDGKIVKTEKNTRELLQVYVEQRNINYEWLKMLANLVGVHQKVPIVFANCFFAPVGGPCKQLTHWYGIHHLLHFEKVGKGTLLSFGGFTELIVPQSKKSVEKMIERTDRLERINTQVVLQAIQEILYCRKVKCCTNVIKQRRHRYQNELRYPNAEALMKDFVHRQAVELIKEIVGEDHLYEEDLNKALRTGNDPFYH